MTIDDLRSKIIADQRLTNWLGMPENYSDLSAQDQVNVTNAMMQYIVDHSELFDPANVDQAQKYINSGIQNVPLKDTSVSATLSDFGSAIADQAVSLNNNLNPFSEQNRKLTYFLVVGGVLLYFVGPLILDAIKEAKK